MILKRLIAVASVLCLGTVLGSCGGATENGVSGYVADHWPRWAGGMPDDVPPRPGTPGYQQFIAHGETNQDAALPANGGKPAVAAKTAPQVAPPVTPTFQAAPAAPAAQVDDRPSDDRSVVQGGLY